MDDVLIQSKRFLIRSMRPEFVGEEYLSWFQQPAVKSYISYAKGGVTLESLRQYVAERVRNKNVMFLGVFSKADGTHLGNIKFEPIDYREGNATLGVLIGNQEWRGKGVFAEVFEATEKALKERGIKKVFLGVDIENTAATTAYGKSGFKRDEANYIKGNPEKQWSMVKEIG